MNRRWEGKGLDFINRLSSPHMYAESNLPLFIHTSLKKNHANGRSSKYRFICKEEKVQFIKSFRRFLHQGKPKRDLFSIRYALHLNDAGVLQPILCFIHVISHL